jgi:hypothetical protein
MKRNELLTAVGAFAAILVVTTSATAIHAAGIVTNPPVQAQTEQQNSVDPPPVGRIGSFRIQSSAQKIVEEDAIKNSLAHPPSEAPPAVTGTKPVKPKKPVVFGKTSDKNEVRPVRGGAEMGSYDSLGGSDEKQSAAKSKAPGKKEDSFD